MTDENRTPGSMQRRPDLCCNSREAREVWAIVNITIVCVRGRDGMRNSVGAAMRHISRVTSQDLVRRRFRAECAVDVDHDIFLLGHADLQFD